jgi:hypothetical protein
MQEPFLNHMFPGLFLEPRKEDYKKRTKKVILYSFSQSSNEYDDYDDEEKAEEAEKVDQKYNFYYKDQPTIRKDDPNKLSLQDILGMLPGDVKPSDVKIRTDTRSGYADYTFTVEFYYIKTFPSDMEAYKRDKKTYDECFKLYEIERAKFEAWKKQKEVEELEAQLQKLKSK